MNETVTSTDHVSRKFTVPPSQASVWADTVQYDNTVTCFFLMAEMPLRLSGDLGH